MTTDAEDRSTWPRNGQVIRRDELLRLIEENGGAEGLDLRGAIFVGDGHGDRPWENPIDLSRLALTEVRGGYRTANRAPDPPWISSRGGLNLANARLDEAQLVDGQLVGADLSHTQLCNAMLAGANLRDASLWCAQLRGATLWATQLLGAYLIDADFHGAHLAGAVLERVDMYHVASLQGASWWRSLLDHTLIRRESLGAATGDEAEAHHSKTGEDYHRAKEAYLLLKNNFNQIGRYEDASWAYVKEQQMEKMAHYWDCRSHGWRIWRAWGSLWRWLRNWAYELATGYGERPWNPVIGGLLIILGFAGGFCATRAIANFWDALIYSLATFATFNLVDTDVSGRGADVASSVEALLGIAVLALVIFTLGNKMSRG